MDYLRGNATASAVGLYVICGYLSALKGGRSEEELVQALQVLRRSSRNPDEAGSVLSASMSVGKGLGLMSREGKDGPWCLETELATGLQVDGDNWPWFRGELLRRMSQNGLESIETEGTAPDLILGFTWFLRLNPLRPLRLDWSSGPEPHKVGFISTSAQWNAFQRWALALGLARRSEQGRNGVLIPDASTAIADQIPCLPASGTAADWLHNLRSRLPIFGAPALLKELPDGGPSRDAVPPGVAMGLLKLEAAGVLSLESADDAKDVIPLGLTEKTRQVGLISVRSH